MIIFESLGRPNTYRITPFHIFFSGIDLWPKHLYGNWGVYKGNQNGIDLIVFFCCIFTCLYGYFSDSFCINISMPTTSWCIPKHAFKPWLKENNNKKENIKMKIFQLLESVSKILGPCILCACLSILRIVF